MKETLKITCESQGTRAIIRINGFISEYQNSSSDLKSQIDIFIASGIQDADVFIKSPGGDVFEAAEISNELQRFNGSTRAILGSICASAATYIASKCKTVTAAKNTSYMIHKPTAVLSGNFDEITARLKALRNVQLNYASTYSIKTGLSLEKIESLWVQEYWMNSEEAKSLGFVDNVEGEVEVSNEDILSLKAVGYKSAPMIAATAIKVGRFSALKSSEDKSSWTYADYQEKDPKGLARLANENKHQFRTLFIAHYGTDCFETNRNEPQYNIGIEKNYAGWTYADYQEKDPKALARMAGQDESRFRALFKAHYGMDC